jgi:hypothetical protein
MLVSASCVHKVTIKIENNLKVKYKHFTKNGESNYVLHMKLQSVCILFFTFPNRFKYYTSTSVDLSIGPPPLHKKSS